MGGRQGRGGGVVIIDHRANGCQWSLSRLEDTFNEWRSSQEIVGLLSTSGPYKVSVSLGGGGGVIK